MSPCRAVSARTLASGVRLLGAIDVPEMPLHTLEDERTATLNMLNRGIEIVPELAELVDQVQSLPTPREARRGVVHRDLHDKQVFISGNEIHLIDLDGVGAGDPSIDVVNLAEHLRLRSLQYPHSRDWIRKLREDFLDLMDIDREEYRVQFLTALTGSRLAGVYALRPLQHGLARRLVKRARIKLEALTGNVRAGA